MLAGAVLLCFLPRVAPRWTGLAVAAGVIIAGLISIVELRSGMPLRKALHLRAMAFEYNRPVLTLLALFWPLFALAISSSGSASSASAGDAPPHSDDASRLRLVRNAHGARLALWSALSVTTWPSGSRKAGPRCSRKSLSLAVALLAWRFSARLCSLVTGIAVTIVFALGLRLRRYRLARAARLDLRPPCLGARGRPCRDLAQLRRRRAVSSGSRRRDRHLRHARRHRGRGRGRERVSAHARVSVIRTTATCRSASSSVWWAASSRSMAALACCGAGATLDGPPLWRGSACSRWSPRRCSLAMAPGRPGGSR